jgi:V/A-type H+/Na+-transporting ATPase subunit K
MRKVSFIPLIFIVAAIVALASGALPTVLAQSANSTTTTTGAVGTAGLNPGLKYLAAGIAFGLAAFGAGYGVGQSGAAAIAAVTEKAEVRTTALIFVVLAEAIAIYGFAIAILILGQ